MRIIERGDLFADDANVLVCPVNTEGVMGKGLALEFRRRFPQLEREYLKLIASEDRTFWPGAFRIVTLANSQTIGLAATKGYWRQPSQIGWIDAILRQVPQWASIRDGGSIAIPALGCGLGGLPWSVIRPLMEHYLGNIDARIYAPLEPSR